MKADFWALKTSPATSSLLCRQVEGGEAGSPKAGLVQVKSGSCPVVQSLHQGHSTCGTRSQGFRSCLSLRLSPGVKRLASPPTKDVGICFNTGGGWSLWEQLHVSVLSQGRWPVTGRLPEGVGEGTSLSSPGEQPTPQREISVALTSCVHPCPSFCLQFPPSLLKAGSFSSSTSLLRCHLPCPPCLKLVPSSGSLTPPPYLFGTLNTLAVHWGHRLTPPLEGT